MRKLAATAGGIFFYTSLWCSLAFSQPSANIGSPTTIDSATSLYHKYLGDQAPIYNGAEHLISDAGLRGFSYFQSDTAAKGFVRYEGLSYKDMDLLYDLMSDQLVLVNKANYLINLRTDKVGEFVLFGHRFIHAAIGPGYYDQCCSGKLTILAKRTKIVEKTIDAGEVIHTVVSKDYYYALINGRYYPLSSQSRLLDLLDDKKKEIRSYIRANRIRYSKDPEQAMVSIAGYYNQISR